jgi:HAD superfamily hydrolase (TIGR01509 family)
MAGSALLIFDCDGVLVDSEMIASRVLAAEARALGLSLTAADCRRRFTGSAMAAVRAALEADLGRPLPADFETRVRARDRAAFEAELKPVAGIAEAVRRLALPRCVASSGAPEKIRHSLELTGLLPLFEPHLFSAHQVARGKPAPDLFLFAAAAMATPPAACVVIEDSVAGVRAGRAAGMRVLGFAGASHAGPDYGDGLAAAGAHAVFADMAELLGLVAG